MSRGKNTKQPPGSAIGQSMDKLLADMKMHKSRKSQNEKLQAMHSAVAGQPKTAGILKRAYELGFKAAAEEMAGNDNDMSDHSKGKDPAEDAILSLRRGWEDPTAARKAFKARVDKKKESREDGDDSNGWRSTRATNLNLNMTGFGV